MDEEGLPPAESMLRMIQELELGHEKLKKEMSAMVVANPDSASWRQPRPRPQPSLIEASRRAARVLDKRHMGILQSMGQAVHVLDCNYMVIYWGRQSAKLFGFTAGEALGKSIIDLAIDEEDHGAAKSIISKVYTGESWTGLFPCKTKWGRRVLALATNSPLFDDDGVLVGEVCIACDSQQFHGVVDVPDSAASEQTEGKWDSSFRRFRNKTTSKLGLDPQQPLQSAISSRISNLASKVSLKVSSKIRSISTGEKSHERSPASGVFQFDHQISNAYCCGVDTEFGGVKIPNNSFASIYGVFFKAEPSRELRGKILRDRDDDGVYDDVNDGGGGEYDDVDVDDDDIEELEKASGSQKNVFLEAEARFDLVALSRRKDNEWGGYRSEVGKMQVSVYHESSGSCYSLVTVNSKRNASSCGSTSNSSSCGSTSSSTMSRIHTDIDWLDYEISWEHLTIGEQIGQGSCGTVYQAQWHGSDVAVKVFSDLEFSDSLNSSFQQELSLMKKLRHPNVLLFMGAVTVGRHFCIVTEFLPRGSLFQLLKKKTVKLDWRRRADMALDIAQGMNYLHHNNPPVIHCDLKSSNLLVDENWNVKVGDFGLSKLKFETFLKTKTGKGTPQWMAPETLRLEPSDEKSDVYSYGVILWELATRKVPWGDLNPMQVIGVVGFKNQRLEIPIDMNPHWASIIQSCWHSDPRSRPSFIELFQKFRYLRRQII